MVYFLRTSNNRTIIECEANNGDLSVSVNILEYSKLLLELANTELLDSYIQAMSDLSELRGWWWEQAEDSGMYETVHYFIQEKFGNVARDFNLNYVTD